MAKIFLSYNYKELKGLKDICRTEHCMSLLNHLCDYYTYSATIIIIWSFLKCSAVKVLLQSLLLVQVEDLSRAGYLHGDG